MIFQKSLITLLLTAGLIWNTGCSEGGGVSLEEALHVSAGYNKAGNGTQESGMEEASSDLSGASEEGQLGADVSQTASKEKLCYVYVCGAVAKPGVYKLTPDSRIVSAIEAAGGFLPEAVMEAVNLAEPIHDGMQITVPDKESFAAGEKALKREQNGMLNINTATAAELCTLSGIGEAKAEAILAYREEIGRFGSIEQLKEVSGIGDSLFNQIKNSIYIE